MTAVRGNPIKQLFCAFFVKPDERRRSTNGISLRNSYGGELCLPFRMESSQGFIRRDNDRELAADSLQHTAGNRDVTFLILQTACQLSMRHPCNVAVLRPIVRPGLYLCRIVRMY